MSYELGARDETWDAGEAEKSYDLPEDASCYMYCDPAGDPKEKASYKLPFVSKDGGKHAVWGAITAIAQRLSQTDIPDSAKADVKKSLAMYYKEAAKKYNDDSIQVPWERSMFSQHPDIVEFERRYGQLGGIEQRVVSLQAVETRDTGEGGFNVTGYGSIFDSRSLDLGGFVEEIAPDAFNDVLTRNPDVHLLWDHDTRLVLARTTNNTLKLAADQIGLSYYGRVAPTSYANDLRILMDRGDIDQASFAFTVGDQDWSLDYDAEGNERVMRRITQIADLYDVTITATGAYPAASSQVARSYVRSYAGIETPTPEEVREITTSTEEEAVEVVERTNKVALAKSRARARAAARK